MKAYLLIPAAFTLALACGACKNEQWPASMAQQPADQPLTQAWTAPEGSVPVGGVEHLEDREDDTDLHDPYPKNTVALQRGAHLFAIYCSVCHGAEGHGGGLVSKVFPPAPDLRHDSICKRTDGFIYGTITAGGRAMPSMREGLSSRDRWDLVAHVRQIQSEGCTHVNTGVTAMSNGAAAAAAGGAR